MHASTARRGTGASLNTMKHVSRQERVYKEFICHHGSWSPSRQDERLLDYPPEEPLLWYELGENGKPKKLLPIEIISAASINADDRISKSGQWRYMDDSVRSHGFEALAIYKSFRFAEDNPFPGLWGVFYREEGLAYIANQMVQNLRIDLSETPALAYQFLRQHEICHYLIDNIALNIEPALGKHLYLPHRHAFRNCPSQSVEESIANAMAFRWAKWRQKKYSGISEFARHFMLGQPNAYRRFDDNFLDLCGEMAANLVRQQYGQSSAQDLAVWMQDMIQGSRDRFVSEYLV